MQFKNMFWSATLFFCSMSSVQFFSHTALAQKTVGGGCFVGTEICDEAEYDGMPLLNPHFLTAQLYLSLENRNLQKEIPQLFDYLLVLQEKKLWLLTDLSFNPEICKAESSQIIEGSKLVACQDGYEVRIAKEFWFNATFEQKRKLIFHEVLIAHALATDPNQATRLARRAYFEMSRSDLSANQLRYKLFDLKFPFFAISSELNLINQALSEKLSLLCSPFDKSTKVLQLETEVRRAEAKSGDLSAKTILSPEILRFLIEGLVSQKEPLAASIQDCTSSQALKDWQQLLKDYVPFLWMHFLEKTPGFKPPTSGEPRG